MNIFIWLRNDVLLLDKPIGKEKRVLYCLPVVYIFLFVPSPTPALGQYYDWLVREKIWWFTKKKRKYEGGGEMDGWKKGEKWMFTVLGGDNFLDNIHVIFYELQWDSGQDWSCKHQLCYYKFFVIIFLHFPNYLLCETYKINPLENNVL